MIRLMGRPSRHTGMPGLDLIPRISLRPMRPDPIFTAAALFIFGGTTAAVPRQPCPAPTRRPGRHDPQFMPALSLAAIPSVEHAPSFIADKIACDFTPKHVQIVG